MNKLLPFQKKSAAMPQFYAQLEQQYSRSVAEKEAAELGIEPWDQALVRVRWKGDVAYAGGKRRNNFGWLAVLFLFLGPLGSILGLMMNQNNQEAKITLCTWHAMRQAQAKSARQQRIMYIALASPLSTAFAVSAGVTILFTLLYFMQIEFTLNDQTILFTSVTATVLLGIAAFFIRKCACPAPLRDLGKQHDLSIKSLKVILPESAKNPFQRSQENFQRS